MRVERVGEEIPGRAERARAGELERRPAGGGGEHARPARAESGEAGERGAERGGGQRAHQLGHGEREERRAERALGEVVTGGGGHPWDDGDPRRHRARHPSEAETRPQALPARGRNERRQRNEAQGPDPERRKASAMEDAGERGESQRRSGAEWMLSL